MIQKIFYGIEEEDEYLIISNDKDEFVGISLLFEDYKLLEEILLLNCISELIEIDYGTLNNLIEYISKNNNDWITNFIKNLKYEKVIKLEYIQKIIDNFSYNKAKDFINYKKKVRCL